MKGLRWATAPILVTVAFAGCLSDPQAPSPTQDEIEGIVTNQLVTVHDALGRVLNLTDVDDVYNLTTSAFSVGQPGPEPSIGMTSNGNLFFQALEKTMRSTDFGRSWSQVRGPLTAMYTSDPFLWVDPTTDRVFQLNMGLPFGGRGPPVGGQVPVVGGSMPVSAGGTGLFCSHLAYSDDYGATWLANPIACGIPFNDHEKLATGPWVGALAQLSANPVYPNAVYYAYNKVLSDPVSVAVPSQVPQEVPRNVLGTADPELGGWIAVSSDGGQTFPFSTKMFGAGCYGSLHGNIAVAPDGSIYVPARHCPGPLVAYSYDNGRTWANVTVGEEAGVPEWQKNPELAIDNEGNLYLTWVGKDNRLYLSVSRDRAQTWTQAAPLAPPHVQSVAFPTAVAGSAGRVGFAYLGTEDSNATAWEVANETRWHIYYTYTLDALDAQPTFVTVRGTPDADPVQRGSICINSGACQDGNRNLLDFIDMTTDPDGRVYIAFADGCTTPQCLGPDATHLDSRDRDGAVLVLREGPSLLAGSGILAPPLKE